MDPADTRETKWTLLPSDYGAASLLRLSVHPATGFNNNVKNHAEANRLTDRLCAPTFHSSHLLLDKYSVLWRTCFLRGRVARGVEFLGSSLAAKRSNFVCRPVNGSYVLNQNSQVSVKRLNFFVDKLQNQNQVTVFGFLTTNILFHFAQQRRINCLYESLTKATLGNVQAPLTSDRKHLLSLHWWSSSFSQPVSHL